MRSALVLELQIVHADDVAVLNAHLLQLVEQTALAQHFVEIHAAFVVGEIDVGHKPLQPRPLHQPRVVLPLDVQRLGGVDLGRPGHVLRLVDRDGRQLAEPLGDVPHQLPGTLMGGGGHGEELIAQLLHVGTEGVQLLVVHQKIGLVGHGDLRTGGQLGAVLLQFGVDGVEIRDGVAALTAGNVHQMHQQTAAVDVPQEIVTQTGALILGHYLFYHSPF